MTPHFCQAWNGFVSSHPDDCEYGSQKWSAALALLYMNLANNGGINSFLTCTHDIASDDVLLALSMIGADESSRQLAQVIEDLGCSLPAATQDERWDVLDRMWSDKLDELDILSEKADAELMKVLTAHVAAEQDYYLSIQPSL